MSAQRQKISVDLDLVPIMMMDHSISVTVRMELGCLVLIVVSHVLVSMFMYMGTL